MKKVLFLTAILAALSVSSVFAFDNAFESEIDDYPGMYLGTAAAGIPIFDWCNDEEDSVSTNHEEDVRDMALLLSAGGVIDHEIYIGDNDCPEDETASSCYSGLFNDLNEITLVENDGCVQCPVSPFGDAMLVEHDEEALCYDLDPDTGLVSEVDIYIDLGYMTDHAHGFGDLGEHVQYTALRAFVYAVGLADDTLGPCNHDAAACSSIHFPIAQDDEDGIDFIYRDNDGDGCTGLEEASAYQSLGGDLSWGTLYRSDDSLGIDNWQSGRKRDQADLNGDKNVSSIDQGLMATKINHHVIADGGDAPNKYDLNGDGVVSSIDQGIMGAQYGDHCYGGPG